MCRVNWIVEQQNEAILHLHVYFSMYRFSFVEWPVNESESYIWRASTSLNVILLSRLGSYTRDIYFDILPYAFFFVLLF